jgi:transcriptional regulator with XRE-family HTH domain
MQNNARMTTFGQRLQHLMDSKNKSQQDVADGLKVNRSRISNWVNDKIASPRRATLRKLAELFSCNLEWLEKGEGSITKEVVTAVNVAHDLKETNEEHGSVDLPEMLKMTTTVLLSETVYKPALASNIRAFHKAVIVEREMNELKSDVQEIKRQMAEVLKQLQLSNEALLAAGITVQKREQKAG